jgi:hypothetical protein
MNRGERVRQAQTEIAVLTAPDLPVLPPIVGADVWQQVTARAGDRCECQACIARNHHKADGRCWVTSRPGRPLHAAPREPTDGIAMMRLGADQLLALCDDCHGAAQETRRKTEQAAARQAKQDAPALFDLPHEQAS